MASENPITTPGPTSEASVAQTSPPSEVPSTSGGRPVLDPTEVLQALRTAVRQEVRVALPQILASGAPSTGPVPSIATTPAPAPNTTGELSQSASWTQRTIS